MASLISLVFVMISKNISAWVTLYAHPGNAGPPDPNEWKYGILLAAEEVVRAGVLSYAPGSESEHVSHVSPFIDWSCLLVCACLLGGALFAFVLFFLTR